MASVSATLQNLLDDLNTTESYNKISSDELEIGYNYPIQRIMNMDTIHGLATVAIIQTSTGQNLHYFLPPSCCKKILKWYANPEDINCYQLNLLLTGFIKFGKLKVPQLKFIYEGGAQLIDGIKK